MLGNKWGRFSLMVGLVCMGWMLAACDPTEDLNAQGAGLAGTQDLDGDGVPDGRPGPGGGGVGGGEHPCDPILRALDQATGEEDIIRVLGSYDACLLAHQPPPGGGDHHGGSGDGGACAPPPDMAAHCEEILKPLHEDPALPPEIGEQLKREFEACMMQAHQDCGCPPPPPPGEVCYEVPADPAACEAILAPLHEGQDLPPEEAERLKLAFEECLRSQPTEVVCPPPPRPGDCQVIPGDPAACDPIKDALGRATDPAEVELLTQELNHCLERVSQEQVVCPPPPNCQEIPPGDPAVCEPLRAELEQSQDPAEQERLRFAFEDCMKQQLGGVICAPPPDGGCHQAPEDPAACEPILQPLKDNPDLAPEEADALFQAFDECLRSQPTIEICDAPPPPPPGSCEEILKPLHEDPNLPPEIAEEIRLAYEECLSQPPPDGEPLPPPPDGEPLPPPDEQP